MNFLKNRFVIGCICIVLAFAVGFIGVPFFTDKTSDKIQVVIAGADIKAGTELTESMFRIIEMNLSDLPYQTSSLYSAVTGENDSCIFVKDSGNKMYASKDIYTNDFVTKSKVTSKIPYKDKELRELEADEFAVTVSAGSLSSSVAGKIRAGDVVTILVATGEEEETEAMIYPELMYMEIMSVSTDEAVDISDSSSGLIPAFVTLRCNLTQARMLAQLGSNYTIKFAYAAHSSSDLAAELLAKQAEYFGEPAAEVTE